MTRRLAPWRGQHPAGATERGSGPSRRLISIGLQEFAEQSARHYRLVTGCIGLAGVHCHRRPARRLLLNRLPSAVLATGCIDGHHQVKAMHLVKHWDGSLLQAFVEQFGVCKRPLLARP